MKPNTPRDFLKEYLALYYDSPGLGLYRALEARLFASLDYPEPVLDLGSGDGSFTTALFPAATRCPLSGLDLSLDCLKQARGAARYDHLIQGDIQRLCFREGAFGTVISNCVLEHVPDIEAAVREVARITRSGGLFYFTVPSEQYGNHLLFYRLLNRLGRRAWARRYVDLVNRRLNQFHCDSPPMWQSRLSGAGFDVVRIAYYSSPLAHRVYDLLFNSAGIGRFRIVALHYRLAHLIDRLGLAAVKKGLLRFFTVILRRYYEADDAAARRGGGGLFVAARKR